MNTIIIFYLMCISLAVANYFIGISADPYIAASLVIASLGGMVGERK